ncbi:MAG: response regulator [Chitinophagaceae bacterium]
MKEHQKRTVNVLKKLKVLLGEDDDLNQLLFTKTITYWEAEIKIASTGTEVLELLAAEDFDIILLDIQLPLKSGIEVAREIRMLKDPVKKNIPIIAITAFILTGEEKKYISAGINACLTKPCKENELYETIKHLIEKKTNTENQ